MKNHKIALNLINKWQAAFYVSGGVPQLSNLQGRIVKALNDKDLYIAELEAGEEDYGRSVIEFINQHG